MPSFIELMRTCYCNHWNPYSERFDRKWWPYINFIGKVENIVVDSENLLRKIGLWESIGQTGWGENGEEPIFSNGHAHDKTHYSLGLYSTIADELLNDFYKQDYGNKYLNFTSKKIHIMTL